jgi:hypothetical protein
MRFGNTQNIKLEENKKEFNVNKLCYKPEILKGIECIDSHNSQVSKAIYSCIFYINIFIFLLQPLNGFVLVLF